MPRLPKFILTAVVLTLCGCPLFADDARRAATNYETDIAPLLRERCSHCHGREKREGGLDLVSASSLLKGGDSGPALSSDTPEQSLIWQRIHDGEMPPEGEKPLSPGQIETVHRWIMSGAKIPESARTKQLTQHDIIPIMLLRCTACHGNRRREADLDLRTRAGILAGGKSGSVVESGHPERSLLIKKITSGEMPPRRKLVSVSVKPMTDTELGKLSEWIRQGLPESDQRDDPSRSDDPLISEDDRRFWSFQPPRDVAVPSVQHAARVNNPIDAFILRRLEKDDLSLSAAADRATLIRRVTFDLIGLPPTPDEVDAFLNDARPGAYERLVDRLLDSPHYGERWARYWLDAAGYADSEGAQNEDRVRPNAWRYRDYVIRSFNADKPYDRFLHEQIAGDELADYEHAAEITPELYDNLVATGFLRMAPDRTFADITNFVPDRLEVIADEMQIFGSSVLGLTLNCARCHTHKFDPIPQRDYYRLAAVFKDAYDEHDWLKSQGPRTLPFVTTAERGAWQEHESAINKQIEPLQKQMESAESDDEKKDLKKQIDALESQRRPEPRIRALWSRGEPSPGYILLRGNYQTPGPPVNPGAPSVLTHPGSSLSIDAPWEGAKQTGRRLALARWLTQPDHPLTARVMVNRIWQHHFGKGIVETPGNFGKTGAPPSHPDLLDWLAREFVRRGWSIKQMHRLIVTSATYRQTSHSTPQNRKLDPDDRLLSRMPLRRMDAETLRDSLLAVAGRLDLKPFGPPVNVDRRGDGLVTVQKSERGWRRSIYVQQRRTQIPTLLENFDFPQMGPNCLERRQAIVAPQALHLMNNATVHELADDFAQRVWSQAGSDPEKQVRLVYRIAIGRPPTDEERQLGRELLAEFARLWQSQPAKEQGTQSPERHALSNYCHAILNSAAFLYID